jgi:hypothetical protein
MEYSTIFLDASPDAICEGHYHVYGDIFKAYLWKSYIDARILMNELLVNFLKSPMEASAS